MYPVRQIATTLLGRELEHASVRHEASRADLKEERVLDADAHYSCACTRHIIRSIE